MSERHELPDLDEDELALLAAFRVEERPSDAARDRVRTRLLEEAAPAGTVVTGPWLRWGAVAVVAAAAVALLTLDWGGTDVTAAQGPAPHQAVDQRETESNATSVTRSERPARRPSPAQRTATPPVPDTTDTTDQPAAPIETVAPTPRKRGRRKASAPQPTVESAAAPAESSLAAETKLLDRARKAVAADRAQEALRLLREAEERFPDGVLRQERAALRVVALCSAGKHDQGRSAAAAFLRAHPRSALRGRVESACPER